MCLFQVLAYGGGVEIPFGVITYCFGGGRVGEWGFVSGSFFFMVVGRRLICLAKIGG